MNDDVSVSFMENLTAYLGSTRPLSKSFRVLTMNPASSGSKGGIRILQVQLFSRQAIIDVTINDDDSWTLSTFNVQRFGFELHDLIETPSVHKKYFYYSLFRQRSL